MEPVTAAIFEPVECGDNKCFYSSSCIAILAGFRPSECLYPLEVVGTTAPSQGDTISEEETISPSGEASVNGSIDPTEDATEMAELECPLPGPGVCGEFPPSRTVWLGVKKHRSCISISLCVFALDAESDFVECGVRKCVYRSPCTAHLAGFSPLDCASNLEISKIKQSKQCPTPNDDGVCGE